MEDKKVLQIILDAMIDCAERKSCVEEYGVMVFNLFTEQGLPPEITINEIGKKITLTLNEKILILNKYQNLIMEHNLKSGLTEKRQKKMQENNKKNILRLFNTGEFNN